MRALLVGAAMLCALAVQARADENSDLNMIPDAVQNAPAPSAGLSSAPASNASGKLYLEDALTVDSNRDHLAVPLPPSTTPARDWQNRTSFDATHKWNLADGLDASLSDRINLYEENDIPIPAHQDFRNDFREGFITWEPAPETYLEAGRINVHNGTALGFNPTDFFKTRTLVDQASADPSVLREDRLGVGMVQAQKVFDGGSISLAAAPKLTNPTPIPTGPPPSLDPGFGRTNAMNRFLLSSSFDVYEDYSPQLLVYHQDGETRFGASLAHTVGQSIVAYGEWAGGNEAPLSSRAIEFGHLTGTLPPQVPDPGPPASFANDAAIGASWTDGADKLTLNLEYHYHQTGLDGADLKHWFALGASGIPNINSVLWYTREYANDQQEPFARQEFFLRADWTDAFVSDLEITAFAFVNAYDGSTLTQLAATYYLSDNWTVGALAGASIGGSHTERGSSPEQANAILQLVRYF